MSEIAKNVFRCKVVYKYHFYITSNKNLNDGVFTMSLAAFPV